MLLSQPCSSCIPRFTANHLAQHAALPADGTDDISGSIHAEVLKAVIDVLQATTKAAEAPTIIALPVQCSPALLRKVVKAIYTYKLELGNDAAEVLMVANALHVSSSQEL